MFFTLILMTGSMISISSNSLMGMWMGLEINLLAFIPLIQIKNNSFSSESSLKYFLSQALASTIFLFSIIILSKNFLMVKNIENLVLMMFNSALLMKMGMAPFHFWFPEVIEGLSWLNSLILLTWQKITPMVLVMYNLNFQYFFFIIIIFSMIISSIMGINQVSLRKILAYSSINHMAWMISAMFFSETIWFYYLIIYFILTLNIWFLLMNFNIFFMNQLIISLKNNFLLKIIFSFNFLSLGGLPPFLGFFPKWLTIQYMINSNWMMLSFFMILITLFTLFYYMRLIFNILILNYDNLNYLMNINYKNFLIFSFNIFTLLSLFLFSMALNFI
uniref:NADH-ubiquinone oxidoreductase chain 2 n=2 Tax=unclassified Aleochara TaxID=2640729 RepID=A0A0S2M6E7_9COLE|nr:NADH deshydrogenase subunit 2 [Aleochara sp. 1 EF-2015]ALO70261.1 NADH deshydrogenase subunit 2 [Aleochara sp. 2 EF-2015]